MARSLSNGATMKMLRASLDDADFNPLRFKLSDLMSGPSDTTLSGGQHRHPQSKAHA